MIRQPGLVDSNPALRASIEKAMRNEDTQVLVAFILSCTKYQIPVDKEDFEVQQFGLWLAGELGVFGKPDDNLWPLKQVKFGVNGGRNG